MARLPKPSEKITLQESKTQQKLDFYEKRLSSMNAVVILFDMNQGRIVWSNEGIKRILGYRKTARIVPQERFDTLYHPDDRDVLKEMHEYLLKHKNGVFNAIYKVRDAHDDFRWVLTSARTYRCLPQENIFEVIGTSIDISEQFPYSKNVKLISQEKLKEINRDSICKISKREKEVLKHFANGFKTREIAEMLDLSFHTVNNHRKNLLKKLQIKNLAALVNFAVEHGLN